MSAPRVHRFDIMGRAFKADPHPTLASMRAEGAMVRSRVSMLGKVWLPTTYGATEEMVKRNDLFVQEGRHAGRRGVPGQQWWMPRSLLLLAENMLGKDEPEHRRLRKLVDHAFARRGILAMRPEAEAFADRLLDEMEVGGGTGSVDLVEAYARRFPLGIICELLGLPEADRSAFSRWTERMMRVSGPIGMMRALGGIKSLTAYLRDRIDVERREPGTGLIGVLVEAEQDGERLTPDELLAMIFLLLIAGFETTTHLIAGSVIALETNPAQKAWLLADPDGRMERAVEELGRFMTPVQTTKPRFVAADAEFHGVRIARGEIVLPLLVAANGDPARFEAPDELRLDRFPNPHLVFSAGVHVCLGMQLARLEAQVAIQRLYARFPTLSLAAPDALDWVPRVGVRGVARLPVQLG